MVKMVRTTEQLNRENDNLEQLIKKKKNEIFSLEQRIQKNIDLIHRKRDIENRTVSVKIISNVDRLTTAKIVDTGETYQWWGSDKPNTYKKITTTFLKQLRELKAEKEVTQ